MKLDVAHSTRSLDRLAASRDLWPGGTLDWWQGRDAPLPEVVAWPEDEEEVLAVLRAAREAGRPVVPYGAGSGVCGGARGLPDAIVLDTKRLDRIGPLDPERWTVEAEAGVNGQHLEDWLERRGWTLGHSPSSIWCSTVGGWAAARSAGQFSSRYGVFEDMVLALRAVAPGRGAFQVGEEGDAPAAWLPLLLGSEGTLAIVTRARMRIWPVPERRWLRGYRMPDVAAAIRAMRTLMQGELWPSVVRLYDPVDTRIGGKTRPKVESQGSFFRGWLEAVEEIPAVRRRLLSLPLALPGLVNAVFDRAASGCLLVVGWEGDPEVVEACSRAGHALLCEEGEDLGEEPGERWYRSRHHVSYKLAPVFERGGFADTMEVACRWSDLEALYDAVREAIRDRAVVMAHMSHVYPEGGSIYFSFAGRGDRATYDATWRAALAAVLRVGGTVTHHHGVGSLKAWAATAEVGPAVEGWRAAKRALDPDGMLNPGRLFVEAEPADPGPVPDLRPEDGVARVALDAPPEVWAQAAAEVGGEPMWPWERLPGPPRWQRLPWETGAIEVTGLLEGQPCRLGRGPRSAAGPDLREHLAEHGVDVACTFAVAPDGERWLGETVVERPGEVALALLRSDLRPAVLDVEGDRLRVGFRGPAAAALGALASARVPGGLAPIAWSVRPRPSEGLVPCSPGDPGVRVVTLQGAFRLREEP